MKYTAEDLLVLRQSPLCTKPANLPPAEQWMGQPSENNNTSLGNNSNNNNNRGQNRTGTERIKTNPDGSFSLDPTNRRSVGDRRNIGASEDVVLGPPKMGFTSGSALRNPGEKTSRDSDGRDRFGIRNRNDQGDGNEYGSGGRGYNNNDRLRDNRNSAFRRRDDADTDNEGWSTVKPRKSFGHEGAERFHGRMGGGGGNFGGGDRFGRDDRKGRDRDDNELGGRDRPRRTFDRDGRDRGDRDGGDENEAPRRNGLGGRGSWFKDSNYSTNEDRPERADRPDRPDRTDRTERTDRPDRNANRERIERTRNWRERDPENPPTEHYRDRNHDRGGGSAGFNRRWGDGDRDYQQQQYHGRVERDPEWMDEDIGGGFAEEKTSGHTEEDFRKFMEAMKSGRGASGAQDKKPADNGNLGRTAKAESAPAVEPGPDRFFEQYSKTLQTEDSNALGSNSTDTIKMKTTKTSSRFTSFFSSQEDSRRQTEPPTPAAPAPRQTPPSASASASGGAGPGGAGGLAALLGPPDANEKEAFKALLQKLETQMRPPGAGGSTANSSGVPAGNTPSNSGGLVHSNGATPSAPGGAPFPAPQSVPSSASQEVRQRSAVASPDQPQRQQVTPQQLGMDRRDDPRFRGPQGPQGPLGPQTSQASRATQQILQEMLMQRGGPPASSTQSPPPDFRPEQMIQDLLAQRQQAPSQNGNAGPRLPPGMGPAPGQVPGPAGPQAGSGTDQREFLMRLMQRPGPEPPRQQEELLMRMPQPQKQVNIPQIPDREAELVDYAARERERLGPQGQAMRPPPGQGPPGMFMEEQFHRLEIDGRGPQQQQQPTQILQRPGPPPGLEHAVGGPPPFLQGPGGNRMPQMQPQQPPQQQQQQPGQQQPLGPPQQQPPPQQQGQQQQPMIPPPPGLAGSHPSNGPNRPMPNMPPNMGNMPPNMQAMPPNMPNMPGMPGMPPMPPYNMAPYFGVNLGYPGGFGPDGIPGGPPRNMPPGPPGFFGGPPGGPPSGPPPAGMAGGPAGAPPGFMGMPPHGMPDVMNVPFDGRGMPPPGPPSGAGYRRQ